MANPNPRIENLNPFPMVEEEPSTKIIAFRVTEKDYQNFMAIPANIRSTQLREFVKKLGGKFKENEMNVC